MHTTNTRPELLVHINEDLGDMEFLHNKQKSCFVAEFSVSLSQPKKEI